MNEKPLESEIPSLGWSQPSEQLDQRIEQLLNQERKAAELPPDFTNGLPVSRPAGGSGGRGTWGQATGMFWVTACCVCLLIGATSGFLGASLVSETPSVTASSSPNPSGDTSYQPTKEGFVNWTLLEKAGLVSKVANKTGPANTEIVSSSVWENHDGSIRETYLAMTKRKVLVVDQENRKVFQMELKVPKTIVREKPGI